MDDDIMRVIVGLPNARFSYTGLFAGRREGVKCPKPSVHVADLMLDVQGGHWVSVPKSLVIGLDPDSRKQGLLPPPT